MCGRHYLSLLTLGIISLCKFEPTMCSRYKEDYYYWNSADPRSSAHLRICTDEKAYEIQPDVKCSRGVFFPSPLIPKCICPFGTWILITKMCSLHTHLLLGDARNICYLIDFPIDGIYYLGDPNNVYATKAYVGPYHLGVLYEIPVDGRYSPLIDIDKPVIIFMFPVNNRSIETEDGNCFPMIQPNPAHAPVHIWSTGLGPTRFRVVDKCQDPLNFGFDDLLSPNMVFVRSNIVNAIPIPKRGQCTRSQFAMCNQYNQTTTTSHPGQFHTPKNHKTLYYDLAQVSPEEVEKRRTSVVKHPFHSVEVMDPREGNFSKFFTEPIVEVELPIMISAKTYKELLSHSSHEQRRKVSREESSSSGEVDGASDNQEEADDLIADIAKDIALKDPSLRKNFLKNTHVANISHKNKVSPSSRKQNAFPASGVGEHDLKGIENDEEKFLDNIGNDSMLQSEMENTDKEYVQDELIMSPQNSNSDGDSVANNSMDDDGLQDFLIQEANENNTAPSRSGRAKYSRAAEYSAAILEKSIRERRRETPVPERKRKVFRKGPSKHNQFRHENKNWNSLENDPSGLCRGQSDPPFCESEESETLTDSWRISDMNTWGTKNLRKLMKAFDILISNDYALMQVTSLFDQAVELLTHSCHIPGKIISTLNMKKAFRILLAQLDSKELQHFHANISSGDGWQRVLETCLTDSGTIKFLFYATCPLRVSCTKYSIKPGPTIKLINYNQLGRAEGPKSILQSTFETLVRFLKLMCQSEVTEKMKHFGRRHRNDPIFLPSEQSEYTEEELEAFLKISNSRAYFTILEKCVSAAETISENRGSQRAQLFPDRKSLPLSEKRKSESKNRIKKRRKKRSAVRDDTTQKRLILDGHGICLSSYWDGVDKSKKEHRCIPHPL